MCGHRSLAQAILHKINTRPEDNSVSLLTKMLIHLQLTLFNEISCKELIQQTTRASEVSHKIYTCNKYKSLLNISRLLKKKFAKKI